MLSPRAFKRILSLITGCGLALVLALSGCDIINPQPTATPTPTATFTVTPSLTPTITLTPTRVRPSATPTITPTPSPTPVTACVWDSSINFFPGQPVDGGTAYTLPQPQELSWQPAQAENEAQLWQLTGLTTRVLSATLSPDNNWLAAELETFRPTDRDQSTRSALYILDGSGQNHWQAGEESETIFHRFDWLPDNRITWVDGGKLYLADSSGTNRQDLNAPEVIKEVWVVKPTLLLASGERHLFRVSLPALGWYRIYGLPGISSYEANLALSPDRDFAVAVIPSAHPPDPKRFYIAASAGAVYTGEVWKIPLEQKNPPDPPDPAFWISDVNDTRRGRINPPHPWGYSRYWQTGYYFLQSDFLPEPYLLDTVNGSLNPYTELIPEVPALPKEVSPDNNLIYVKPHLYGAHDWKIHLTVTRDINFIGWLGDSSGMIFSRDEPDGTQVLFRYQIATDIEASFAQISGQFGVSSASAPSGFFWIADKQQDERGETGRIQAFSTELQPAAAMLIREPHPDQPRLYPAGDRRLFINAVTYTGGGPQPCAYTSSLLRWDY